MNQLFLVGRINTKITYKSYAGGKREASTELAVKRSFKNANGEYQIDYIPFKVDSNCCYFEDLKKYTINSFIGLKGALRFNKGRLYVEVEKITDLGGFNE